MLEVKPHSIAVIPLYDPSVTKAGLYIPENAKTRSDQGIVKYVGKDCKWLRVGDWVLFSGWTGSVVDLEGEGRLLFMPERLVEAVIHEIGHELIGGLFVQNSNGVYEKASWETVVDILASNAEHLSKKYRMVGDPAKYREREQRMRYNATSVDDDIFDD